MGEEEMTGLIEKILTFIFFSLAYLDTYEY